jgi:biotin synthase
MLITLANLPEHPESVPVNMLIPIDGTPLAKADPVDPISFVRTIALARILMPRSDVRLSAGRNAMTDEMQALCFFAGANSIFIGGTLLTAANPSEDKDQQLLRRLGMERTKRAANLGKRGPNLLTTPNDLQIPCYAVKIPCSSKYFLC